MKNYLVTGGLLSLVESYNNRNLSKHIDALPTQLSMINIPFDKIGISETKHQINEDFLVYVDMQGCSMYTQPS